MCRFYGFLANEPTKVECTLVHAQNALMHQSRADLCGKSHSDGWGICCYPDGMPQCERRATAAHEDLWFSTTAERVYSHAVIAHVRRATVGRPRIENTHPFTHGCWTFAHNGTLTGFVDLQSRLRRSTAAKLLRLRRGSTDSELIFYWLLTRMEESGIDVLRPAADAQQLADVVASSVRRLNRWNQEVEDARPARLNFLLTDGQMLVASRWQNSLHWIQREGIHDCEICGIPHIEHQPGTEYRALVVASEPISHEAWERVPDRSVLVADGCRPAEIFPIGERSKVR